MWALASCTQCGMPIDLGSRTKRKRYCDGCKKTRQRQGVQAFVQRQKKKIRDIERQKAALDIFNKI